MSPDTAAIRRALEAIPFNHPSEREFAELLTYYGVEWRYEPRTFPLAWDEAGRVTEAFTPDFYLPAEDLYVELTTRRQRLATEKHRKLRKLGVLHPEVRIKLLHRRDYEALARRFGWAPGRPPGVTELRG